MKFTNCASVAAGILLTALTGFAQGTVADALAKWKPAKTPLVVTVETAACEESCPVYSVVIASQSGGAGSASYTGGDHVLVEGAHATRLSKGQMEDVVASLRQAGLAGAATGASASSRGNVSVGVPVNVTVLVGSQTAVAAAAGAAALAAKLNAIVGTDRWIRGNGETVAALQGEHWDFRAADPSHAALLVAAAGEGNIALVKQLVALGAQVNARGPGKSLALFAAIEGHHAECVQALLAAGADRTLKSADGELPLDMANELGYDDIAGMLR